MAKTPRPNLDDLPLTQKPSAAMAPVAEPKASKLPASSRDGRVPLIIRIDPTERRALRRIAADGDTTIQTLVIEAVRDIIRRSS